MEAPTTSVHLFDLPKDILRDIAQSADKTAQYTMSITCKYAGNVIKRPVGNLCDLAAHDDHLEVLDWAIDAGYIPTEQTCAEAAAQGDLHILKYLHVMAECPWDASTTTTAAAGGHLWTLDYALNNGCPYEPSMLIEAAKHGYLEILEYAYETPVPDWMYRFSDEQCAPLLWDPVDLDSLCKETVKYEHLHILEWLCPRFVGYGHVVDFATKYGVIKVIEWLVNAGVPLSTYWLVGAVSNEQIPVIEWLYEKGCPGLQQYVRANAEFHHRQKIIEWCDSKGL